MPYVICEPCIGVKDGACVLECPVTCIYPAPREGFPNMLFIHPGECINCGLCVSACPVDAIYEEDDVPQPWSSYISLNAAVFDSSA